MADRHSKETRSYNMSRIRSKDTKPEEIVRKYLFSKGLRYRKNYSKYIGHPDIVLPKYKTIIFVNGCFWHHHEGCPDFVWPKTNCEFWESKLKKTNERDGKVYNELMQQGWKIIIVWECELKKKSRDKRLFELYKQIVGTI